MGRLEQNMVVWYSCVITVSVWESSIAMEGRTTQDIIEGFPESAAEYLNFINCELGETLGASFFSIHPPAPEDMTHEQLEVVAAHLRSVGWNAEVAPISREEDEPLTGIRIKSED
jgi:hypothetical protein